MSADDLEGIDVPKAQTARELAALVREKKPALVDLAQYLDGLAEFLDRVCDGALVPDVRPGDTVTVVRTRQLAIRDRPSP
jgi:hypothetical protein